MCGIAELERLLPKEQSQKATKRSTGNLLRVSHRHVPLLFRRDREGP